MAYPSKTIAHKRECNPKLSFFLSQDEKDQQANDDKSPDKVEGAAGLVFMFAEIKRVKFFKGLVTFFCHDFFVCNKIKKIPDLRRGVGFMLLQLDQNLVEWAVALEH